MTSSQPSNLDQESESLKLDEDNIENKSNHPQTDTEDESSHEADFSSFDDGIMIELQYRTDSFSNSA